MAKKDKTAPAQQAVNKNHQIHRHQLDWTQKGRNTGAQLLSSIRKTASNMWKGGKRVRFATKRTVREFQTDEIATMITYDSGADGHYISEKDRKTAGLPILRASNKRVAVANGATSKAKNVTQLPFVGLSQKASQADTFDDFPTSLMSVRWTADDGMVSIFTNEGVTVHKEQDVLITCKGKPILIGVRDENGRYRVPLMQQWGQWQPRAPRKRVIAKLQQANSVYDLPTIEQGIKWMHAVCVYPVKSTWLKAIKADNFIGWPLLNEKNVNKYYPDTDETVKGHLNQARKNVRSTKKKQKFEQANNVKALRGKKIQDVYVKIYDTRETIFTDQTGQFPTRSQQGNKYIIVLVKIDSNAILVEPMKNRTDAEMIKTYDKLITRLQRVGCQPKKHVLDNKISENMKNHIRGHYKFAIELVPPGNHPRNAAEVAIRNFKSHFLSVLAGTSESFPPSLWDRLLPQTKITLNLLRQSNATPTVSAYAHLCGPFDYNKMPLAPMGCDVQVHEKTDKRGTWAYHSVDGWYLNTSPEHYRVHNCHIKQTKQERFSDTVHFKHKSITNPELSPQDKIMMAIASCREAIEGKVTGTSQQQSEEIKNILNTIEQQQNKRQPQTNSKQQSVPRVANNQPVITQPTVPRVQSTSNATSNSVLRMAQQQVQARQQRAVTKRRRNLHISTTNIIHPNKPPALSTQHSLQNQNNIQTTSTTIITTTPTNSLFLSQTTSKCSTSTINKTKVGIVSSTRTTNWRGHGGDGQRLR